MFFVSVPEGSVYVVERLGRFHATLPPGRHFIAPVLDRVANRFEVEQTLRIEKPRATVRFRIVDARRAHETLSDLHEAARRLMTMVLSKDLSETRVALADANQFAESWGVVFVDVVIDRF